MLKKYKIRSNIIIDVIEDEMVVTDEQSEGLVVLNSTASLLLHFIDEGTELKEDLQQRWLNTDWYDVPSDVDLNIVFEQCLTQLVECGLVELR